MSRQSGQEPDDPFMQFIVSVAFVVALIALVVYVRRHGG